MRAPKFLRVGCQEIQFGLGTECEAKNCVDGIPPPNPLTEDPAHKGLSPASPARYRCRQAPKIKRQLTTAVDHQAPAVDRQSRHHMSGLSLTENKKGKPWGAFLHSTGAAQAQRPIVSKLSCDHPENHPPRGELRPQSKTADFDSNLAFLAGDIVCYNSLSEFLD